MYKWFKYVTQLNQNNIFITFKTYFIKNKTCIYFIKNKTCIYLNLKLNTKNWNQTC